MSRRKRRSAARGNQDANSGPTPATPPPDAPRPKPPRPNRPFLLVAALLQSAWIGFLVVMALRG